MKKQYKSLIIKIIELQKKKKKNDGVHLKGYVGSLLSYF